MERELFFGTSYALSKAEKGASPSSRFLDEALRRFITEHYVPGLAMFQTYCFYTDEPSACFAAAARYHVEELRDILSKGRIERDDKSALREVYEIHNVCIIYAAYLRHLTDVRRHQQLLEDWTLKPRARYREQAALLGPGAIVEWIVERGIIKENEKLLQYTILWLMGIEITAAQWQEAAANTLL